MRLHLGCGKRFLKGWHHRDIQDLPHLDSVGPVNQLDLFESGSIDEIYASHVLEYFDQFEVEDVLREWNRVLRPGVGRLRVAVPNFPKLIEVYNITGNVGSVIGPIFGRMEVGKSQIYHRSVWDLASLTQKLVTANFIEVLEYSPVSFLNSLSPGFDDHSLAFWPHMDQTGIQISLCLTGVRSPEAEAKQRS